MRRTREQYEAAEKLKALQQEHSLLTERSIYLGSLLHQQWENYRRHRYRQDLMLLITILQEVNLVKDRLDQLAHNKVRYEIQLNQKSANSSAKTSAERLKAVTQELRELNKKCRELEKEETSAIERCVPVIEFMDLDDMHYRTRSRMEVLSVEKKMLQQKLKQSGK
jgi:hypothetical protein